MEKLIQFTASDLAKITNHRSGEIKFGEKMVTIPKGTDLNSFIKTTEAKYVLLGIPEDIGIRANYGRPGAASAWESAIKSIANCHIIFCLFLSLPLLQISPAHLAQHTNEEKCRLVYIHPSCKIDKSG